MQRRLGGYFSLSSRAEMAKLLPTYAACFRTALSPCVWAVVGVRGLPRGRVEPATGEQSKPPAECQGLGQSPALRASPVHVSSMYCTVWGLELSCFRAGRNLMEFSSALYYAVLNCSLIVSRQCIIR